MFVTFEGGEGAGKSTQLQLLAEELRRADIPHITTREPGGSAGAEEIRQLIVSGDAEHFDAETETLLILAARMHHVRHTIEPALLAGKWVLCDRFFDSTLVYQGLAKGMDEAWLTQLHSLLFANLRPDLTLYFDIDPAEGLARAAARGGTQQRFESLPIAFHQRLRDGFLALAEAQPQRIRVIDAAGSVTAVQQQVQQVIFGLNQSAGGLAESMGSAGIP